MLDHIKKGHVESVTLEEDNTEKYYLPHHAIKKERLGITKWRIVFDGSSHTKDSPSLNDSLEMGPNLLPDLLGLLLRFRLHPAALVSDISQAFLQLVLDRKDRDLTRFIWYEVHADHEGNYTTTNDRTTYRFTRLPFGLTCSPFLLSATLRELATMYKTIYPLAASLVTDNMYMDDFAAGSEDDKQLITLYNELTTLMGQISLPMAKWATNSQQLMALWDAQGVAHITKTQVLGIVWDTQSDTLALTHRNVAQDTSTEPITKRLLLQATAKLYDPLGLLSPVSLIAKLLFQETWTRGIGWDELLPPDLGSRWHHWVSTLPSSSDILIPRWVGSSVMSSYQIHVFCDSSERAYGAALYLCNTGSKSSPVHLVCSKNRLAPVKRITLPRLELLAALIGSRLLRFFCEATNFDATTTVLWTD